MFVHDGQVGLQVRGVRVRRPMETCCECTVILEWEEHTRRQQAQGLWQFKQEEKSKREVAIA
jgi:hypothetical protein